MKTITSLLSVFALIFAVLAPAPLAAAPKVKVVAKEGLGGLQDGMSEADVLKALGKPKSKGREVQEGATGMWTAEWSFPAKGLSLVMTSTHKGGSKAVQFIHATAPCDLATKRGIHVGSTAAEAWKAYNVKAGKQFKDSLEVGSVHFEFKDGKVSRIDIGTPGD